jgi:hypothetical protein
MGWRKICSLKKYVKVMRNPSSKFFGEWFVEQENGFGHALKGLGDYTLMFASSG